jgi:hypothetical protein
MNGGVKRVNGPRPQPGLLRIIETMTPLMDEIAAEEQSRRRYAKEFETDHYRFDTDPPLSYRRVRC